MRDPDLDTITARPTGPAAEPSTQPGEQPPAERDAASTPAQRPEPSAGSLSVYREAIASVELLSAEDERALGRELSEARAELTRVLAAVPEASLLLCAAWAEAKDGARYISDVVHSTRRPAEDAGGPEGGAERPTVHALARRLADAAAQWRHAQPEPGVAANAERAAEIRARLEDTFAALGPAFVALREIHEALARTVPDGGPEVATAVRSGRPLVARYQRAWNRMVEANLRLVMAIARRFEDHGLDMEDLVQEGNLGLFRAADKFDHSLGFKFSTYASRWIWQAITRAIAERGRTIRVPSHVHDQVLRLGRLSGGLRGRLAREPRVAELADESERSPGQVRDTLRVASPVVSLDAPLGHDAGDATLGDLIQGEGGDPIDDAEDADTVRKVLELLSHLPEREALIIKLRYGIGVAEPYNLEQIGSVLGVTRERARQLESRAMSRLREDVTPELALILDA